MQAQGSPHPSRLCSVAPPDRKAGGDYCFSQRWKEPHANSNNHCTCAACDSLTRKSNFGTNDDRCWICANCCLDISLGIWASYSNRTCDLGRLRFNPCVLADFLSALLNESISRKGILVPNGARLRKLVHSQARKDFRPMFTKTLADLALRVLWPSVQPHRYSV